MKKVFPIMLSSIASALLAVFIYAQFLGGGKVVVETPSPVMYTNFAEQSAPEKYVVAAPTDFVTAADKVTSAVVHIKSLTKSYDWWGGANYATSSGSGVIISSDGYIVTNNHVIEGATEIEVNLNDRRIFPAKLVGTDPTTDLALLRIDELGLPSVRFADSDKARIGEWVLAIGNPFSLTSTVTAGIISAKSRSIDILDNDAIESFIQTDAAVNPGNSGGALVNTNGDLVGINTAIITKSGRYEGYSFAVPSNLVKKVVSDLKEYGKIQRGLLNVMIDEVSATMVKELGLPSMEGVYIHRVNPGGAAEDAGLKAGDVITKVNGKKVKTTPQLQEIVGQFRPGDKLKIGYIRKKAFQESTVVLKDRYNSIAITKNTVSKEMMNLGFELRNMTSDEQSRTKSAGVKVISIIRNSKIDGTNMEPGYIITKLNDTEIKSVEDLVGAINIVQTGEKVMFEGFYEDYPDEYFYAFRK